jgi:hypothetical protein
MKNIHLLPTEKPSRLFIAENDIEMFILSDKYGLGNKLCQNQNLYITNDEDIKEGDWVYFPISNEVLKIGNGPFEASLETVKTNEDCKKIILTTDPSLDGIQAIDDEFLEWFVKNPSCESVKLTDSKTVKEHIWDGSNDGEIIWEKEIIIPQEEPKDRLRKVLGTKEPKQETLEEAAETIGDFIKRESQSANESVGMVKGAKWQQERSYSEEEVIELLKQRSKYFESGSKAFDKLFLKQDLKWFEQFKKK